MAESRQTAMNKSQFRSKGFRGNAGARRLRRFGRFLIAVAAVAVGAWFAHSFDLAGKRIFDRWPGIIQRLHDGMAAESRQMTSSPDLVDPAALPSRAIDAKHTFSDGRRGTDWRLARDGFAVGRVELPNEAKTFALRWEVLLWSPTGTCCRIPVEADGSFRARLAPGYYGMAVTACDPSCELPVVSLVNGEGWEESAGRVVRVWAHDAAPPAASDELCVRLATENGNGLGADEARQLVGASDGRVVRGQNLRSHVVQGRLPPKVAATVFVAGAVAVPVVYVSSRHDVAISSSP
ncbi:MAG: hypothetical protein D6741_10415 [Planctomycetota bacterium]|nr:MAG: hypothetical protein D6741_10415 [Planctomycetota bacterium]